MLLLKRRQNYAFSHILKVASITLGEIKEKTFPITDMLTFEIFISQQAMEAMAGSFLLNHDESQ